MSVYIVQNYQVSRNNNEHNRVPITRQEQLIKDHSYHIKIQDDQPCIAWGDIDHCPDRKSIGKILTKIVKMFQIESDELSYTISEKITDDKPDCGAHWSIPSIETTVPNLKLIIKPLQEKFGQAVIDVSVYKNSWFRLPYQTNRDKTNVHEIIQGEPIDFMVHDLEKVEFYPPAGLLKEEVKMIREVKPVPRNNNDLTELKMMILKIIDAKYDYFESYDEWLKLMFIIYNESNGSTAGLDLFNDVSSRIRGYKGIDDISKRWYQHKPKRDNNKLTIKSIFKIYYEFYPEERKATTSVYDEMKVKFEEKVFKLYNPISYVIENDKGFQSVNNINLNEWAMGQYSLEKLDKEGNIKNVSFVDEWRKDKNIRAFDFIDFEPNVEKIKDKKIYNLFKGFKYVDGPACIENESAFLLHLKRVSNNDDVVYEYLKQWIAHIIQKPWMKTNTAVVLYSDTKGSGKNSIITGIEKLLGSELVGEIAGIEDIMKNFNSHLCNKLLIYGDEINGKAKEVNNRLKAIITRETQNLEAKGKDSIRVSDKSNYIFTTNDRDAFKVEDGDRRLFMVNCLEKEMINKNEYYEYIQSHDEMSKLFNFFKNYNLTYKIGIDKAPDTEYKMSLNMESKPAYYKYMFLHAGVLAEDRHTSNEIFNMVKDYAKSNYLISSFTIKTFGLFMREVFGEYNIKPKNVSTYDFSKLKMEDINKILQTYDEKYFNYINDLDV
tara:strand:- start:4 stop:2154 length:2151 start_codon:yes stop_codon:yes gene_type:complete